MLHNMEGNLDNKEMEKKVIKVRFAEIVGPFFFFNLKSLVGNWHHQNMQFNFETCQDSGGSITQFIYLYITNSIPGEEEENSKLTKESTVQWKNKPRPYIAGIQQFLKCWAVRQVDQQYKRWKMYSYRTWPQLYELSFNNICTHHWHLC